MRQVSKAAQQTEPTDTNVLELASNAVSAAEAALIKAKEALASAGGATGSKGGKGKGTTPNNQESGSKGSGGRTPSPVQVEIREAIIEALQSGEIVYFTVAELVEGMKADRIQTRNAINYLETQNIIVRYGEKLPEGRGQREMIYKAGVVPEPAPAN